MLRCSRHRFCRFRRRTSFARGWVSRRASTANSTKRRFFTGCTRFLSRRGGGSLLLPKPPLWKIFFFFTVGKGVWVSVWGFFFCFVCNPRAPLGVSSATSRSHIL